MCTLVATKYELFQYVTRARGKMGYEVKIMMGLVALAGLVWQIFRSRRRAGWGKVKTECHFTPNTEHKGERIVQTGPASLSVAVVNHGAGAITIRALKGCYRDGSISDIPLRSIDQKLVRVTD